MWCLFGFMCVLALGLMGCSAGDGGEACAPIYGMCANAPCCGGLYCFDPSEGRRSCAALPSSCEPECDPSSSVCDGEPSPVCGNDGNLYDTQCDAYRAGLDVGTVCGAELTPAGRFPCGPFYCHAAHFCHLWPTDVPSEEKDRYSCEALPDACEAINEEEALCQCVAEEFFSPFRELDACYSVSGNGVTGLFVEQFLI